jgi:hypothetical protein
LEDDGDEGQWLLAGRIHHTVAEMGAGWIKVNDRGGNSMAVGEMGFKKNGEQTKLK